MIGYSLLLKVIIAVGFVVPDVALVGSIFQNSADIYHAPFHNSGSVLALTCIGVEVAALMPLNLKNS